MRSSHHNKGRDSRPLGPSHGKKRDESKRVEPRERFRVTVAQVASQAESHSLFRAGRKAKKPDAQVSHGAPAGAPSPHQAPAGVLVPNGVSVPPGQAQTPKDAHPKEQKQLDLARDVVVLTRDAVGAAIPNVSLSQAAIIQRLSQEKETLTRLNQGLRSDITQLESQLAFNGTRLQQIEEVVARQKRTQKHLKQELILQSAALKQFTRPDGPPALPVPLSLADCQQLQLVFEAPLVLKATIPSQFQSFRPLGGGVIVGSTEDGIESWVLPQSPEMKGGAEEKEKCLAGGQVAKKLWKKPIIRKQWEVHQKGLIVVHDESNKIHVLRRKNSLSYVDVVLEDYSEDFAFDGDHLITWRKDADPNRYFFTVWKLHADKDPEFFCETTRTLACHKIAAVERSSLILCYTKEKDGQVLAYPPLQFAMDPFCRPDYQHSLEGVRFHAPAGNGFFVQTDSSYRTGGAFVDAVTGEKFKFPFSMTATRIARVCCLNDRQSFLLAMKDLNDNETVQLYLHSLVTKMSYPLDRMGGIDSLQYMQDGTQFCFIRKEGAANTVFHLCDIAHLKKLGKDLLPLMNTHLRSADPGRIVLDYLGLDLTTKSEAAKTATNPYHFVFQLLRQNQSLLEADASSAPAVDPAPATTKALA